MPPELKPNHHGIKRATEAEAAAIFALAEVAETAAAVAAHFREADLLQAQADALRRSAVEAAMESESVRRQGAGLVQAEGGRIAHVRANELSADRRQAGLAAAVKANESERETLRGERAWAELSARHGLYIPHGRRLETRCAEHPGQVYCYDVDEGEMGQHAENACPNGSLRHDRGCTMLRRKGKGGRLEAWPGRDIL